MGDGSVLLISFLRALMMQTWNSGEQQGGMCSYSFMGWKCWMKKASCTAHSAVTGCKRITPSCIGIAFLWRKKIGRLTSNGSHFENSESIACCSTYIYCFQWMNLPRALKASVFFSWQTLTVRQSTGLCYQRLNSPKLEGKKGGQQPFANQRTPKCRCKYSKCKKHLYEDGHRLI